VFPAFSIAFDEQAYIIAVSDIPMNVIGSRSSEHREHKDKYLCNNEWFSGAMARELEGCTPWRPPEPEPHAEHNEPGAELGFNVNGADMPDGALRSSCLLPS
jgi:hypothetical protein